MVVAWISSPEPARYTGTDGPQNSLSTWRHAPHGETGTLDAAHTTATAVKARRPDEMAETTALLSAQMASP